MICFVKLDVHNSTPRIRVNMHTSIMDIEFATVSRHPQTCRMGLPPTSSYGTDSKLGLLISAHVRASVSLSSGSAHNEEPFMFSRHHQDSNFAHRSRPREADGMYGSG